MIYPPPLTDPVPRSQLPHYKILFRCLCYCKNLSCPGGFKGDPIDPKRCVDADECSEADNPPCVAGGRCHNLSGGRGYFCVCPAPDNNLCFNCSCERPAITVTRRTTEVAGDAGSRMVVGIDALAVIVAALLTLLSKNVVVRVL